MFFGFIDPIRVQNIWSNFPFQVLNSSGNWNWITTKIPLFMGGNFLLKGKFTTLILELPNMISKGTNVIDYRNISNNSIWLFDSRRNYQLGNKVHMKEDSAKIYSQSGKLFNFLTIFKVFDSRREFDTFAPKKNQLIGVTESTPLSSLILWEHLWRSLLGIFADYMPDMACDGITSGFFCFDVRPLSLLQF